MTSTQTHYMTSAWADLYVVTNETYPQTRPMLEYAPYPPPSHLRYHPYSSSFYWRREDDVERWVRRIRGFFISTTLHGVAPLPPPLKPVLLPRACQPPRRQYPTHTGGAKRHYGWRRTRARHKKARAHR